MVQPGKPGPDTTVTSAVPAPAPQLEVPKTDLGWRDCTRTTLDPLALGPGPAGLVLECAVFTAPSDADGMIYGTTTVAVTRARLPQTPANAAPIVLTSGTDRPSSATLAALATAPSNSLLAAHPVVSIDRRGLGASLPVTCLPPDIRTKLLDNGQDNPSGGDPVTELAALSDQATTACKDFLQPQELTYDAVHAADDIDQLRKQWRVDRIGLLGIGNGALVATSYAAKYPENIGRLALDSPQAFGANQVSVVEQRVQGAEAAMAAFAQRCTAIHCSLGADPRAAVIDLLHRGGAGQLPGITANALLVGISGFLGSPRGDQADHTAELADALSAASRGDIGALRGIIDREIAQTATDGQFVANCSDLQQRAPLQQARELRTAWGQKYPVFGEQGAVGLIACTSWPTMNPAPTPTHFKVPTLVLSGAADPVTGKSGIDAITGGLSAGGAANTVVTWQGFGHPTVTHSSCAQQFAVDYLATGKLPRNGAACPA